MSYDDFLRAQIQNAQGFQQFYGEEAQRTTSNKCSEVLHSKAIQLGFTKPWWMPFATETCNRNS